MGIGGVILNVHGQFSIQELGMIYYIIFLAWIMDMLVLTNEKHNVCGGSGNISVQYGSKA